MADRLRYLAETAQHNGEVRHADEADFVDPADGPMFLDLAARLSPEATLDEFRRLYVASPAVVETRYRGFPIPWCPFDLWTLQELVFAGQPYWLVETDTLWGGMAFWLGDLADGARKGRVLSTGLRRPTDLPNHPRVSWLDRDPAVAVGRARQIIWEDHALAPAIVIVHGTTIADEYDALLRAYAPLAPPGSYVVAAGTWIPAIDEVVRSFQAETDFLDDPDCARHGLTLASWLHLPPEDPDLPSAP